MIKIKDTSFILSCQELFIRPASAFLHPPFGENPDALSNICSAYCQNALQKTGGQANPDSTRKLRDAWRNNLEKEI
jgi:hypothetical protein